MSKIGIFMADGCEEIEGLTVVDIVRRAGIDITTISISDKNEVAGAHGITFLADAKKDEVDFSTLDGIVLPGGMPGTTNLGADETVDKVIREFAAGGKLVAAICAAPSVLGQAGILNGKHATSYPGFEPKLTGAVTSEDSVVQDGNVITSRGMGTAIAFALEIVSYFTDKKTADKLAESIIY
ncbi:DJ-1/PfpI family protein [Roseburia sp. MUC/MUC-530-WT-4D]|uniref:DJ-1/PfpI family protein n=1 Tax=Roseburia porci TaxID=2605790 RepID=A0A6L5YPJ0_9FIRM|nr:DJ-1 family glyoxalase III [Roseburia porci]MCI5517024.1 DJ-1/PfpI family protein [Roseburia sp.]MDD6742569.1 DJ-1/PfpI family protein [Roseburia porci]MST74208.1 DJ-1/PfpI family protein [Roseburia porci]